LDSFGRNDWSIFLQSPTPQKIVTNKYCFFSKSDPTKKKRRTSNMSSPNDILPEEVLQHVFNYLTLKDTLQTMSLVNSNWKVASYHSILSLSFVGNYSFQTILKE